METKVLKALVTVVLEVVRHVEMPFKFPNGARFYNAMSTLEAYLEE